MDLLFLGIIQPPKTIFFKNPLQPYPALLREQGMAGTDF
jgi:hypothetical protein